jgi:hypothetical protein
MVTIDRHGVALIDTAAFRLAVVAILLGGLAFWLNTQDWRPFPEPQPQRIRPAERLIRAPAPAPAVIEPDAALPAMDEPEAPRASRPVAIYPVRPEVFCSQMAAFGVAEARLQPNLARSGSWECVPVLLSFGPKEAEERSSVYTSIRGRDGAPYPFLRIKLNALDPSTEDEAKALVVRVLRSATRSFGVELPGSMIQALEDLEAVELSERRIRLSISGERDDPRRYNIFLQFDT